MTGKQCYHCHLSIHWAACWQKEQNNFKSDNVIIKNDDDPIPFEQTDLHHEICKNSSREEMIAASRELRKTSQKTLAEGIGVQAQVISAMENGRRPVSRNMAAKLGKFFKCSPKIFFAFPDNL